MLAGRVKCYLAVFLASDGEIYTACFSVQKYKQTNMQPKIYFVFCKKRE